MKKISIIIFITLILNCYLAYSQFSAKLIDTALNDYVLFRYISCNSNKTCNQYLDITTSEGKKCNLIKRYDFINQIWEPIYIDCSRLIYDSVNDQYYQYYKRFVNKIITLDNESIILNNDSARLLIKQKENEDFSEILTDTFLFRNDYSLNFSNDKNNKIAIYTKVLPDSMSRYEKRIFISNNYGQNWEEFHFTDTSLPIHYIYSVYLPTDKDIVISTYYRPDKKVYLLHSFNNGKSWEKLNFFFDTTYNNEAPIMFWLDSLNVWMIIRYVDSYLKYFIYFSQDAGYSWKKQLELSSKYMLKHIEFVDKYNGFALGPNYGFYTRDGGNNWIPIVANGDTMFCRSFNEFNILDKNSFLARYDNNSIFIFEMKNTDIKSTFSYNEIFQLYYNNNIVSIDFSQVNQYNIQNISLTIYNLLGTELYRDIIESSNRQEIININFLPQGVYFISCTSGGVTEVKKICVIKQR